jgi:hypothetical protein
MKRVAFLLLDGFLEGGNMFFSWDFDFEDAIRIIAAHIAEEGEQHGHDKRLSSLTPSRLAEPMGSRGQMRVNVP